MRGCAILLPAAGASARMGGADKLLQPVDGMALLRHAALRALETGADVAVTLRPEDEPRNAVLEGLNLTRLVVPDAAEGMAASLRAGAIWASGRGAAALMIALPDMPEITARDMRALIDAQAQAPDQPLRACTADNIPGHPVILPRACFAAMDELRGDAGARALFQVHAPRLHPLAGARAVVDLDTPEAWAEWRAMHARREQD
ncbi:MAG: nucleotidyltransferase family protein [Roseinatronobacter sp.]|nr:nucleotidyltransferase family protein [Roseinatronobacter sp.]